MTTAHRPTFYQALGGDNQGGNYLVAPSTKVSSRDLASHTTLKFRQARPLPMYSEHTQAKEEPSRESLKEVLHKKEQEHYEKIHREKRIIQPVEALKDSSSRRFPVAKLPKPHVNILLDDVEENPFPQDEDDTGGENLTNASFPQTYHSLYQEENEEGDDDETDDDDDDEAELMRELEKIKEERQMEELKQKETELKESSSKEHLRILHSNPLMLHQDSTLKRRWDDDVVFRNQAKNIPKIEKRFINDTVRSDFHKKFLARYIQ
ncbi:protein CWC15 homolog [Hylaeus volcanicus]|uniref:protein CWC15 homolog n=1 Tax=Hylaeus volcanicus TaxID=313075 RepID=UPI0023B832FB|nr:protein CWC15 homolog [Hylaeus volcanicus]